MHSHDQAEALAGHIETALRLLDEKESRQLSQLLERLHPVEVVNMLQAVEVDVRAPLLKHITGLDTLSELVAHAGEDLRNTALSLLDDSRIAAVVRRLAIDDAADVVGDLPRRRQVRVLKRLSAATVKELTSLLAYDQDSAGRIMTTRFLSFHPQLTVNEAILDLRTRLHQKLLGEETDLFYGYVVDHAGLLRGVFSIRELLSADAEQKIDTIMNASFISIAPEMDQEQAAKLIADYDLSALPVVSPEDGKMLGIITIDDVIDVLEDEHTEDILRLAGTEDQDTISAPVGTAFRSRLPWLVASCLGGIGGAMILGGFSDSIQQLVALAFFMPVVFGMGGNVGSQSSTITVRGLATGELANLRMVKRLKKEAGVGATLGVTFGVLLFSASYLLFSDIRLSGIVGLSIAVTMSAAAALGSALPLLFNKFGIDPAIASGPLVTTTTDILSITIYFSIAGCLL